VSFKPPQESQNYDKYVSLNEYVLVSIMRHLESATNYLLEADQAGAVLNLNYAWTITPSAIKKKIVQSPSVVIEERIRLEVPRIADILKHKDWIESISDEEVDLHTGSEGLYLNEIGIRAELYRQSKILGVIQSVLFDLQLDIVEGLEGAGLYISTSRRITPTAERTPEQPLPILNKLPASLPR
jgi:hypothetical protein